MIKNTLYFNENDSLQLFAIARNSIETKLGITEETLRDDKYSSRLHDNLGAFVTLKKEGQLRGCIGRFTSENPLYKVVKASAASSAFEDPRFSPLTKDEYDKLELEITVLGPLQKISDINDIIIGRHGVYVKKDNSSGTLLPQVATEHNWTVEEFLGYTSRDKAGLGWEGWKTADIFIYEGIVLEEK